ncbi:MAG: hypothetical protein QM704_16080 [Anaeromyxobacteraceae bacterium]
MRKLVLGAVLALLFSAPALARAAEPRPARGTHAKAVPAETAPAATPAPAAGEVQGYAERDRAAAPKVGGYAGGDSGVYITSGAIIVALLVVLLLTVR